jgi:hypothetical protein
MMKTLSALVLTAWCACAFAQDINNPQTNASALTTGTVAAARGGAGTINGALKGNGSGVVSQAACADLSNATTYCSSAQGQLPGIATNTGASAGNVGELVLSAISTGSAVSLTNGTPANLTSISLTAGDWDVTCDTYYNITGTTTLQYAVNSISTTSATLNQASGFFGAYVNASTAPTLFTTVAFGTKAGPSQQLLASTTTVFCVVQSGFTASTVAAWGTLRARRTH